MKKAIPVTDSILFDILPKQKLGFASELYSDVYKPDAPVSRRSKVSGSLRHLDMDRTISATCQRMGFFTPVFSPPRRVRSYLILIDPQSFQDQQARRYDELTGRLMREPGISVRNEFELWGGFCAV